MGQREQGTGQRPEDRRQMPEVRRWISEAGRQKGKFREWAAGQRAIIANLFLYLDRRD